MYDRQKIPIALHDVARVADDMAVCGRDGRLNIA
jgi:hypothetical protein